MGQVSKVLGATTEAEGAWVHQQHRGKQTSVSPQALAQAPRSVLEATSLTGSSIGPSAPAAECELDFDLNPAGFSSLQASSKEQVDLLLTAFHLELNPDTPAFVVPSSSLMDASAPHVKACDSGAVSIPHMDAEPRKLVQLRAPSQDQLPFPNQLMDLSWQKQKKCLDRFANQGFRGWTSAPVSMDSLPCLGTKSLDSLPCWGTPSLDSLPGWGTTSLSVGSLPSPRQFMNTHSQAAKMQTDIRAKQGKKGKPTANTMKAQLEALRLEDPAAVFIVRGISKLGFSSSKVLRAYFSRYGEVKTIYVSPSRVKSMHKYGEPGTATPHWRLRAAPLGFILMKSAEATARILADGPELEINDVTVRLQPFRGHADAEAATNENDI